MLRIFEFLFTCLVAAKLYGTVNNAVVVVSIYYAIKVIFIIVKSNFLTD